MAENDKDKLNKVSSFTLGLIIGSVVLVMVFALGLLYPQYRRITQIKTDRINKTIRLEEQKRLFPIYVKAEMVASEKFEPMLPLVERKAIPRDQVSGLSAVFSEIAEATGMSLEENSLDIDSFDEDSAVISLDVMFKGDIFSFRDCLIGLAELPYLKGVENIDITTDQTNVRQCGAKLQIAVEKNATSNQKS